jgi:hypothetical protein
MPRKKDKSHQIKNDRAQKGRKGGAAIPLIHRNYGTELDRDANDAYEPDFDLGELSRIIDRSSTNTR